MLRAMSEIGQWRYCPGNVKNAKVFLFGFLTDFLADFNNSNEFRICVAFCIWLFLNFKNSLSNKAKTELLRNLSNFVEGVFYSKFGFCFVTQRIFKIQTQLRVECYADSKFIWIIEIGWKIGSETKREHFCIFDIARFRTLPVTHIQTWTYIPPGYLCTKLQPASPLISKVIVLTDRHTDMTRGNRLTHLCVSGPKKAQVPKAQMPVNPKKLW